MKNILEYQQFLREGYKEVGSGSESIGKELDVENSKLIMKKPIEGKYDYLMNEVHDMMSKRSDLFCRIKKHNNDYVIAEKLDTQKFEKIFEFQKSLIKSKSILFELFDNGFGIYLNGFKSVFELEKDLKNCIYNEAYKEEKFYKNIEDVDFEFIKKYILLKYEILKYFENFSKNSSKKIILDLHEGSKALLKEDNFGFIKGTDKIRCFDPIFI